MREARFDPVESDRKQVSRFSLWSSIILMAAILAVAGIVSALTAMRFAIRGREVAIPPLAGKTADEAKEILSHNGLLLKVSTSRFSSKVPEGHILDQIPPSGSRLKINRTVKVLLSLGERRFPSAESRRDESAGCPAHAIAAQACSWEGAVRSHFRRRTLHGCLSGAEARNTRG